MKFLNNFFKSILTVCALGSFGSAIFAQGRLDDLRYCSSSCDYRCYNLANEARDILSDFRRACGERPRLSAQLTANGRQSLTVQPGYQINFQWNSFGASSASSSSYAVGSSNCATNSIPWVANTLQGSNIGTIQPRQVGCTYYISYRVFDNNGNAAQSDIQITVVN